MIERDIGKELEILRKNIKYGIKLCQYNIDFSIVEVDDSYAALLGYTPEEKKLLVGRAMRDGIHPGDAERVAREILQNSETEYECIYRLKTKTGSYMWVRDTGEVVEYEGEEYVQSMVVDIDEQEILKRQRDIIYDSLPGGVVFFVISRDNFYVKGANKQYFDMMGVDPERYLGTSGKYTFPEDLPKFREYLVTQGANREPIDYEFRTRRGTDGEVRWYRIMGNYYDSIKEGELYLCLMIDITNRKRTQFDLMKEKDRYRLAMKNTADLMYEYDVRTETLRIFGNQSLMADTQLCVDSETSINYKQLIFQHELIYKGDRKKIVSFIKSGTSSYDNIRMLTREIETGKEYYDNYEFYIHKVYGNQKISRVIGYIKKASYNLMPVSMRKELHQIFDEHVLKDYSFILKIDVPTGSFTPYFIEQCGWENYNGNRYYDSFLEWWCKNMVHPDGQKEMLFFLSLEQMLRILHSGEPSGYRFCTVKGNDSKYKYKICTFSFYGSDVNTIMLVLRDVNSIRAQEQYQERENQKILTDVLTEARIAVDSRRRFMDYIVRELSEPVTTIKQMLYEEQNEETIKNIGRCVEYMGEMIGSIEAYNRVSGTSTSSEMAVSLYEICTRICEEERKISLGLDVSIHEHITIPKDRLYFIRKFRFREILVHLFGNAIKYAPKGSVISMHVREEDQKANQSVIHITMEDDGPLVDTQFYERVLDERYESDFGEKIVALGPNGSSISIASKITALLGGSIEFHKGIIRNNIVEVRIPVSVSELDYLPQNMDEGGEDSSTEVDLKGQGILLVESADNEHTLLAPLLRVNGAKVYVASSGAEGIRLLNDFTLGTITVILVDRELSDMNCYEFAQKIKYMKNHSMRKIPVIEMLEGIQTDDTRISLTSGINAMLNKPVNLSKLAVIIENLLEK